MPTLKLDAKTVASLKLPDGKDDDIFWDAHLAGFGIRLRAGGHRSWVAQYRAHGRTRRLTIGSVEKLNPIEARKTARMELAKVELGGDPQGAKQEQRRQAVHTLRAVAGAYLEAKASELRPSSLRVTRLYLTGAYFKPLHTTSITAISHPDVAARIGAIKRTSGSVTAKQARAALSSLYKWAMGEGLMGAHPFNPVIGTNVPAGPQARERVLADQELIKIWNACADDDYGRIIWLLILLGSRRAEIGGLAWSELDLEAGLWSLPATRSKNKYPLVVPLPPAALAIIKAVPRWANRDQLFGTRAQAGFTEWDRGKRALDARAGVETEWRVHDLRRTVATRMGDIGVLPHVIEAALNHRSGAKRGVAGIYNKSPYQREVATALQLWSEYVTALVEGRENKVIPLQA
jgi:integrase